MAWDRDDFRRGYKRLAPVYDRGLVLYELVGMRFGKYRRETIAHLQLQPGDTVVDLGCGTGVNLPYLVDAVGPEGRVIVVDLTPEMLTKAREKIDRAGWQNVELVESDMADFSFPEDVTAVLSTLALATIPDYDAVVQRVAEALSAGGRFANFELTWPEKWPDWLVKIGSRTQTAFGVTADLKDRKPATSIRRYFDQVDYEERYFGAVYLCTGTAK